MHNDGWKLSGQTFTVGDAGIPRDQDQATGLERKELDSLLAGVDVCELKGCRKHGWDSMC